MPEKINRSRLVQYIIQTLTLTLILGLIAGIVLGLIKSWKYVQSGYFLLILDALNLSINQSLFVALLFFLLFLVVFLVLSRVIRSTWWTCFIAGAISCLPFFLIWGYRINKAYGITRYNFFEPDANILNLKVGMGFILLWLLASVGLFIWTKSKILKAQPVNIKLLGSLLGIVIVFNVSMYLFYNSYKPKENAPNILLIVIDCLGAGHLSSYGYTRNTTPNIDEFSKDAVIFTQAISQSTFTKTSIASLFTSLYPYQHGVHRGSGESRGIKGNVTTDALGEEETTLAEVLLINGFLTTAWIDQAQLTSYLGFSQGFVDYHERLGGIDNINKKFMKWIKRVGKKHKFFAYIHYLDLHSPYEPKPPYDTLYLNKTDKEDLGRFDYPRALYDGQLTYIDTEIGTLLDDLKKEGLYDNTLVIITSDHGDEFGQHGAIGHSKVPYDEVIRVPLIIKFPESLYAGTVVENQVRLIDIKPTILDYLKIEPHTELSGFSLMNYLDSNEDRNHHQIDFPRYAISEIYNMVQDLDVLAIRTEEFKYIHFKNKDDELYDLKADPEEQNNLIKKHPEVAEKFNQMLPPILAEKNQKRVKQVSLDKKTIEELKALGYIQ